MEKKLPGAAAYPEQPAVDHELPERGPDIVVEEFLDDMLLFSQPRKIYGFPCGTLPKNYLLDYWSLAYRLSPRQTSMARRNLGSQTWNMGIVNSDARYATTIHPSLGM